MNNWALITGATSGIGKAFAYHYVQEIDNQWVMTEKLKIKMDDYDY